MVENIDSKLDVIMNAIASLWHRTIVIGKIIEVLHNDGASVIEPSRAYKIQNSEETTLPLIQQDLLVLQRKKPRVSLLDKFDGTGSKFWDFINQIRLITFLQPERYPTKKACVRLLGTLVTKQALS